MAEGATSEPSPSLIRPTETSVMLDSVGANLPGESSSLEMPVGKNIVKLEKKFRKNKKDNT